MPCGCSPKSGPAFDPDFEGPSCEDLDRFGSDTATCPECGQEVYDDAAICPNCGHAIIAPKGRSGLPKALIGAVAIVVVAAFLFAFIL